MKTEEIAATLNGIFVDESQRIKLDLDDGVRVNYGKFGTLLAETKHITGGSEE